MVCGYSPYTWTILLGMILTGAARSIVVKCTFQSGLEAPLTVTLLYLLGQSFSLVVYGLQKWLVRDYQAISASRDADEILMGNVKLQRQSVELVAWEVEAVDGDDEYLNATNDEPSETCKEEDSITSNCNTEAISESIAPMIEFYAAARASFYDDEMPNGSNHALRWASLVYIDASVAEMLISGLGLTLSVVAGRILRKRMSILSVLQDIGEEIFMQTTDFPATLLLGLEGCYAFFIFLVVYATIGNELGVEDIDATMSALRKEAKLRWLAVGLPFLFLVTGLFNIKATAVTSAMTRNVWKTLRTVLVWITALAIFYLGNSAYGEPWHDPESFRILFGFFVMCGGILTYYWYKDQEKSERINVEAPK
ncbi:hypothetical protein ACHAXT_008290 [Thalassiosira profunda]